MIDTPETFQDRILKSNTYKEPPLKLKQLLPNIVRFLPPYSIGAGIARLATIHGSYINKEMDKPNINSFDRCVELLIQHIDQLTEELNLEDIGVPIDDRPIRNIGSYSFVSLSLRNEFGKDPKRGSGYVKRSSNPDVLMTYPEMEHGKPFLDSPWALGLVYNGKLIALASATVTHEGVLKIVQIQDVSGVRKTGNRKIDSSEDGFYRTGLHNGLDWRCTLVRAWEGINQAIGGEQVIVRSAHNSPYPAVWENGKNGYDKVAKRLGYSFSKKTGDWHK